MSKKSAAIQRDSNKALFEPLLGQDGEESDDELLSIAGIGKDRKSSISSSVATTTATREVSPTSTISTASSKTAITTPATPASGTSAGAAAVVTIPPSSSSTRGSQQKGFFKFAAKRKSHFNPEQQEVQRQQEQQQQQQQQRRDQQRREEEEEILNDPIRLKKLQAIVFAEDALSGRSIYHLCDRVSLELYRMYYSKIVQGVLMLNIIANLLIAYFEYPSPLSIPFYAAQLIELATLILFAVDAKIKYRLFGHHRFAADRWLLAYVVIIAVSFIDLIVDMGIGHDHIVRFRRLMRPFFFIQNSTLMKKTVKNIGKSLPEIINVFILLVIHIFVFSLFGRLLFWESDEGKQYFNSLGDSLMSLFVLLTTANYPDVMMPAYNENRWYSLYFIIFLVIGLYCLMNLLTAVIYNQFRGYLQGSMQTTLFRRRVGLRAAFEILKHLEKIKTRESSDRKGANKEEENDDIKATTKSPSLRREHRATSYDNVAMMGGESQASEAKMQASSVYSSAGDLLGFEQHRNYSSSNNKEGEPVRKKYFGEIYDQECLNGEVVSTDSIRILVDRLSIDDRDREHLILALQRRDNDPEGNHEITLPEMYSLFEPIVIGLWSRAHPSANAKRARADFRDREGDYYGIHSNSSFSTYRRVGYFSKFCDFVKAIGQHRSFNYVSSFLLVAMAVITTIMISSDTYRDKDHFVIFRGIGLAYALICVLECSIRIYSSGLRAYLNENAWNFCDLIVIGAILIVQVFSLAEQSYSSTLSGENLDDAWEWVRIRHLLFTVRLARLVPDIPRLRLIAATIAHLARSLATFAGVLIVIYYSFASIGIEFFAGKIDRNDPRLQNTSYAIDSYWANNFDDFAAAQVTLWELMVVNNWFVIMDAFAVVTSEWSRIYFVAWFLVSVVIAMNLFIALLLEAFIIKWEASVLAMAQQNSSANNEMQLWSPMMSEDEGQILRAHAAASSSSSHTGASASGAAAGLMGIGSLNRPHPATKVLDSTAQTGKLLHGNYRRGSLSSLHEADSNSAYSTSNTGGIYGRNYVGGNESNVRMEAKVGSEGVILTNGKRISSASITEQSDDRYFQTLARQASSSSFVIPNKSTRPLSGASLTSNSSKQDSGVLLSTSDLQRMRSKSMAAASNALDDMFRSNLKEPDDQIVFFAVVSHKDLSYLTSI